MVSAFRPHRARPGGALASAQVGCFQRLAPTGLAPVERRLLHQRGGSPSVLFWSPSPRSTETSSVGAGNAPRFPSGAETSAPPRQARWGRCAIRASSRRGHLLSLHHDDLDI